MALSPPVSSFANLPGGGVAASMNALNALANNMHLRKINQIKAQYAPQTTLAEAASKLAYANLMAPQFIAKAMGNPAFMANLSEQQKNMLKDLVYNAGAGGAGGNILNQVPAPTQPQQQPANPLAWIQNQLGRVLGGNGQPQAQQANNALVNPGQTSPARAPQAQAQDNDTNDTINHELDQKFMDWANSPEGIAELKKGINAKVPPAEELLQRKRNPTYAQNAGKYLGEQKEEEELGKYRAEAIKAIGNENKQLSATGANLDKLINHYTDPDFIALREQFPFLQDMQLKAAAHVKDPQTRYFIGKIIADIEAFKGSTVQGFKGQTLKREFDYADKLKPSDKDTVYTALGKIETLKALKEIAWEKNKLIRGFIKNDKMDLAEAVEKADKMVDIKAIDKKVAELTQPMVPIKDKDTGLRIMVPKARAKQLLKVRE